MKPMKKVVLAIDYDLATALEMTDAVHPQLPFPVPPAVEEVLWGWAMARMAASGDLLLRTEESSS